MSEQSSYKKLKPGPALPPADVAADQLARIHQAMIEIVAEGGYDAFKVRDVVRRANVSSRSFYQHFDSKDECFVRTYEMIVSRSRIGLIGAQMEGKDWRARPRMIFAAFARELEDKPAVARFALVDVYSDGPQALERAHQAEANFASMLAKSFGRAPGGIAVPTLVVEGIMAGITRVGRTRLLAGTEATMGGLEDEMMKWALCFPTKEGGGLLAMDEGFVRGNAALLEMRTKEIAIQAPGDNRATILAAVSKLTASDDYLYKGLTVPTVRAAAGVSRRNFDAEFDSVEECFLAALDLRAATAIADAATEQMAAATWEGGVYRAISSLCIEIAGDPLLARVCFQDDFVRGSKGSLARLRLITGVADQIRASAGSNDQATDLAAEASAGAIWALFHHHALRSWVLHRPEMSATLAYMALAPLVGGANAITAMRDEQTA